MGKEKRLSVHLILATPPYTSPSENLPSPKYILLALHLRNCCSHCPHNTLISAFLILCMLFCTWLFFFCFILAIRVGSFHFTAVYYSIEWINHNLFNQSLTDRHFHCFLSFAINNTVMNILVHISH
uniref:Uncharacterized protein n=1 Tax=Nomascus leucogenys TaxID=61853 RepID=A0A2I3HH13_NOMLE